MFEDDWLVKSWIIKCEYLSWMELESLKKTQKLYVVTGDPESGFLIPIVP